MSRRSLAAYLGLSLVKTNYCLRALIGKGWVKMKNFRSNEDKLGYAYLLTLAGLHAKGTVATAFIRRKLQEFAALKSEIALLKIAMHCEQSSYHAWATAR